MNHINLFSPRVLLGLTLLVLMRLDISAQAQDLDWAKRAGGTGYEAGHSIAVDALGNSYVTGRFSGSATFGPGEANQTILTGVGGMEIFVAKYNSSGELLWAKPAGGADDEIGHVIAVDASGNCYVTGLFRGSATFGQGEANQTILTSAGLDEIFVAKYNSSGELQWAKGAGSTGFDNGYGIAVDALDNSYVTGRFTGSVIFGKGEANQTILTSAGSIDIFVAKYNSSGDLQWVKAAGGAGLDTGFGIAVGASGDSYVTGLFAGSATFGTGEANQTILTSAGSDVFVARFNSSGDLLWAKRAGSTDINAGYDIAVDASGNSYVTGIFHGSATFGPGEANQTILTSAGDYDIFVARYNSNGDLLWAKPAGNTSFERGFGIAVDASGNSHVTGRFSGSATFGLGEANQTILTSTGLEEIFVAKYNSSGELLWAKGAGSTGLDEGYGIAVDASGNTYVTGRFTGSATFGLGEANQTILTGAGDSEAFVVKFQGAAPPIANAGGPHSVNENASVTVTASGNDPKGGSITFAWDLDNDGTFETSGQSATFSAANLDGPSSHTIKVQVTNNDGLTATAQATINVLNVAPTATFTSTPSTIIVGQSVTLAFTDPLDPSAADVAAGFQYFYDCTDDGTFENSDPAATSHVHTYPASGSFSAKGRIQDKDGGLTDYTAQVIVLTPQDAVQNLIDQVLALNKPQGDGLIDKLNVVIDRLDDNRIDKAIDMLQQFINQVNVFMGNGTFTAAEGQPLIDAANAIITALNNPTQLAAAGLKEDATEGLATGGLPTEFQLAQNSPNPFNPTTTIQFSVPREGFVRLKVYNSSGAEVATLVEQQVAAGSHKITWNASHLASGVYMYRLEAEGPSAGSGQAFAQAKRLLLMK